MLDLSVKPLVLSGSNDLVTFYLLKTPHSLNIGTSVLIYMYTIY